MVVQLLVQGAAFFLAVLQRGEVEEGKIQCSIYNAQFSGGTCSGSIAYFVLSEERTRDSCGKLSKILFSFISALISFSGRESSNSFFR